MKTTNPNNIDSYIAGFAPEIRERLEALRNMVYEAVPQAEESISYRMPVFRFEGVVLVYFAAFKKYIRLYTTSELNLFYKNELSEYLTEKGVIRLPHDKPIPYGLLKRILSQKANRITFRNRLEE